MKRNSTSAALARKLAAAAVCALAGLAQGAAAQSGKIFVGQLTDNDGPTKSVSLPYTQGVRDAIKYMISSGDPVGQLIEFESADFGYEPAKALQLFRSWDSRGLTVLHSLGTPDTLELVPLVTRGQIPTFSASAAAPLADPTGKNPKTKSPAPYNFFYGSTYSDGCRALVQWAKDEWGNTSGVPLFVHAGDGSPFSESPRAACAEYADELGFKVLPSIFLPAQADSYEAQCIEIKESAAHFVFIANLGPSVGGLLRSCEAADVDTQFLANIWAGDDTTLKAAGNMSKPLYFVASSASWDTASRSKLFRSISENTVHRNPHYIRGVCTAYYMKEAIGIALAKYGTITGQRIRDAMYEYADWELEGLKFACEPSTWTPKDHRGTMIVGIATGRNRNNNISMRVPDVVSLPRRADWLGY